MDTWPQGPTTRPRAALGDPKRQQRPVGLGMSWETRKAIMRSHHRVSGTSLSASPGTMGAFRQGHGHGGGGCTHLGLGPPGAHRGTNAEAAPCRLNQGEPGGAARCRHSPARPRPRQRHPERPRTVCSPRTWLLGCPTPIPKTSPRICTCHTGSLSSPTTALSPHGLSPLGTGGRASLKLGKWRSQPQGLPRPSWPTPPPLTPKQPSSVGGLWSADSSLPALPSAVGTAHRPEGGGKVGGWSQGSEPGESGLGWGVAGDIHSSHQGVQACECVFKTQQQMQIKQLQDG